MTFYKCEHCGNIIAHIQDSGVRCHCCGEEMKPLVPNTSDGAGEKHVPVVQVDGQTVTVTVVWSIPCWKLIPSSGSYWKQKKDASVKP